MTTITIIRRDGTPVIIENVKHVLWTNGVYRIITGEHGNDRVYHLWPFDVVDHIRVPDSGAHP